MTTMRVHLPRARFYCVCCHLLKLGHNLFDEVAFHINRVKVLLEVGIGKFVSGLKLAIVITLFLNCIVS
jgi:hypothetical protein